MAHKSYFFAAGATQKSTLHSPTVMLNVKKMEQYRVKIIKKPINHPMKIQYTDIKTFSKKEFLRLKKDILMYKINEYSLSILSGQMEPLLLSERVRILKERVMKNFVFKKSLIQMQNENTKREYYQKNIFG